MPDSEDQPVVITDTCAKCGETFETELEPDGEGGQTAMTVCNSCFEYASGPPPRD